MKIRGEQNARKKNNIMKTFHSTPVTSPRQKFSLSTLSGDVDVKKYKVGAEEQIIKIQTKIISSLV